MAQIYERFKSFSDDLALPVAAINTLNSALASSEASTMMGIEKDLKLAASELSSKVQEEFTVNKALSVQAGCDLFIRYVLRTYADLAFKGEFNEVKASLVQRGNQYAILSGRSREQLASYGFKFLADGCTVLLHGSSRAVMEVLKKANQMGRHFDVIVVEGRPSCDGYETAKKCTDLGIPVSIILDSAVASIMERVDLVLIGSEAITVNGGVVNSVGSFQMALIAKAFQKPFYVASESFKFTQLFPLNQRESSASLGIASRASFDSQMLVKEHSQRLSSENIAKIENENDKTMVFENTLSDYTPPELITLMFTDLGVLTPAGISDACFSL